MVQRSLLASTEWWHRARELVDEATNNSGLILIVGVGHPFRRDDNVGSRIVQTLSSRLRIIPWNVRIIDAQDQPENVLNKFENEQVKLCILIDALEMNALAGTIRLFDLEDTDYPYFTSHNVPLKLIVKSSLPNTRTVILGVQPETLDFGTGLSSRVEEAKNIIVAKLGNIFENTRGEVSVSN